MNLPCNSMVGDTFMLQVVEGSESLEETEKKLIRLLEARTASLLESEKASA